MERRHAGFDQQPRREHDKRSHQRHAGFAALRGHICGDALKACAAGAEEQKPDAREHQDARDGGEHIVFERALQLIALLLDGDQDERRGGHGLHKHIQGKHVGHEREAVHTRHDEQQQVEKRKAALAERLA
ncbi:hypothetical protein SDC9_191390 [bioreactor metagenome]|uniref:Uncharacterized protein n=1 Tax=bioreactor metagenome TaxID=1076179 RepID=A0A645I064_9ZZZZ